jgi:SAM-dependent methyltransferase
VTPRQRSGERDVGRETGYRDLAAYYSLLFPLNDGQREFFAHLLAADPIASVLDVGCGTGEHLAWFSERGVRAFGLEPDEAMFRELRRRAWPGTVPSLAQAGVEALPGAVAERVDLVLCLGNTLPHLRDRGAVREALCRMGETLSPGGRLVVQTVNFDKVLAAGASSFPVIERTLPGGGRIAFQREYDLSGLPARILFKTRLGTPAGEHGAAWPLVPLRREELAHLMRDAGLEPAEEYGDYSRVPFAADSPALILVGRRGWQRPAAATAPWRAS